MKKTQKLFILLLVCLSLFLIGCAQKEECDFCGKMGKGEERSVLGEDLFVCKDCIDTFEAEKDTITDSSKNDHLDFFEDQKPYQDDVDNYLAFLYCGKFNLLESLAPEEFWQNFEENYDLSFDNFKDALNVEWETVIEELEKEIGPNIKVDYELNERKEYDEYDLKELIEELNKDYGIAQNITAAFEIGLDCTIEGDHNGYWKDFDYIVVQIDNNWYVTEAFSTINNLTNYVKSYCLAEVPVSVTAKDLTPAFIEQIKQYAYEVLIAHTESEARYYGYNNIKYECTYFCDNEYRNDNYNPDNPKTKLAVFFSLDRTDCYNNGIVETKYYVVTFSSLYGEIVLCSDGTYKVTSRGDEYDIDAELGSVDGWGDTLDDAMMEINPLFEDESYYSKAKIG